MFILSGPNHIQMGRVGISGKVVQKITETFSRTPSAASVSLVMFVWNTSTQVAVSSEELRMTYALEEYPPSPDGHPPPPLFLRTRQSSKKIRQLGLKNTNSRESARFLN